jgi:hypothetical protein
MPVAIDRSGTLRLWHDEPWAARRMPGIREVRNRGFNAVYRLDLAVTKPGAIVLGVEILNSCSVGFEKGRILHSFPFETVEIDAQWVIDNPSTPDDWHMGIIAVYGSPLRDAVEDIARREDCP